MSANYTWLLVAMIILSTAIPMVLTTSVRGIDQVPRAPQGQTDPLMTWTAEERARGCKIVSPAASTLPYEAHTGFRVTWEQQASYWGGESFTCRLACDSSGVRCEAQYEISPGGLRSILQDDLAPHPQPECGAWLASVVVPREEADRLMRCLTSCDVWNLKSFQRGVDCDVYILRLEQNKKRHTLSIDDIPPLDPAPRRLLSALNTTIVGKIERDFRASHPLHYSRFSHNR